MSREIRLRPHHSLCIQFFIGKGYSESFVCGMTGLITMLEENNPQICLHSGCDSICVFCPNNLGAECSSAEKVGMIDNRCLDKLRLEDGCVIDWQTLKRLAFDRIILAGKLSEVCLDCCWRDICLKAAEMHTTETN